MRFKNFFYNALCSQFWLFNVFLHLFLWYFVHIVMRIWWEIRYFCWCFWDQTQFMNVAVMKYLHVTVICDNTSCGSFTVSQYKHFTPKLWCRHTVFSCQKPSLCLWLQLMIVWSKSQIAISLSPEWRLQNVVRPKYLKRSRSNISHLYI